MHFQSKTKITNLSNKKVYLGHTKNILGNPINSLFWLIKELQNREIFLNSDFWVTTGSTTAIVPVQKNEKFIGEISPIGKVQVSF